MKEYDILILTHMPAFYKINLYNELNLRKRIFVVFISGGSVIREQDFTAKLIKFDHVILNRGSLEERSRFFSIWKLLPILIFKRYSYIIMNGWDAPEFWVSIIFGKNRKGIANESTIYESGVKGVKGVIKKIFVGCLDFAMPSGTPHQELLEAIGFRKPMLEVGGVGIPKQFSFPRKEGSILVNRFIFVGRLSHEKNIHLLIETFRELPNLFLTILGSGELEKELMGIAAPNIQFKGYVNNDELYKVHQDQHVLILPSISEPWGLVVEEAIQNGLPVIVSDKVGCRVNIVEKFNVGRIFRHNSKESLKEAIAEMRNVGIYKELLANTKKVDFKSNYDNQVNCYSLNWLGANDG